MKINFGRKKVKKLVKKSIMIMEGLSPFKLNYAQIRNLEKLKFMLRRPNNIVVEMQEDK